MYSYYIARKSPKREKNKQFRTRKENTRIIQNKTEQYINRENKTRHDSTR